MEAPADRLPFQLTLLTVTFCPDWDQVPDQPWVRVWLPAKVQVTVHPVIAADPAVTVRPAWNPLPQSLVTEYVAVHAEAAFAAGADAIAASPAAPRVNTVAVVATAQAPRRTSRRTRMPACSRPRHAGALNLMCVSFLCQVTATLGRRDGCVQVSLSPAG